MTAPFFPPGTMKSRDDIYASGAWIRAHGGGRLELVCPSTEEIIGSVPDCDAADVETAVVAAAGSFADRRWAGLPIKERAERLGRALDALERRSAEIADLVTTEMGSPVAASKPQVARSIGLGRWFIDTALSQPEFDLRSGSTVTAAVFREPVGVVAAISPWNGPFHSLNLKAIPALIAGCSVVYKPAPETPLDAYLFAEALSGAGVPPGAFNLITGGRDTGRALVAHPAVSKVTFTGSTAAGREIGEECGRSFKRAGLELGGKSAMIVLPDADLDTVVDGVMRGAYSNSGQLCAAFTRILLPAQRRAELTDAIVAASRTVVVGDPFDTATTMGPLVSRRQYERVLGYVDIGRDEGARVLIGGKRPAEPDRGYYVEPTIFDNVAPEMRIAREEIFGPVACLLSYDTVEEAIAIANDSEYGLHGGVFSEDPAAALAVARRVRTGTLTVNGFIYNTAAPFGGVKCSGIGRDTGVEGLEAFYELKTVNLTPAAADLLQ